MKIISLLRWAIAAALSIGLTQVALAQEFGTRDEAKTMVDAAVDHVKKVGPEQAFKDFTDKSNKAWQKKDLYVFAYTLEGVNVAHGANEKLLGKNLIDIKDPNGKPIIREIVGIVTTKGAGWIDYEWAHPQSKKIESKASYVRKLANYDGFVGVGVYR